MPGDGCGSSLVVRGGCGPWHLVGEVRDAVNILPFTVFSVILVSQN